MKNVLAHIEKSRKENKKLIAILIDPEKCDKTRIDEYLVELEKAKPDFIFVGGSQLKGSVKECVEQLKSANIPIVLFPGNAMQLCPNADALLMLSLISGRNAEYLIGQHIKGAIQIKKSGIEVIPTGYILIDGGKKSAVETVSKTSSIVQHDLELAQSTALAGELLGMQLVYLEAGSGATQSVPPNLIKAVKNMLSIPIIVGGGIKNRETISEKLNAGADLLVIGNHLEEHLEEMYILCQQVHNYHLK